MFLNVVNDLAGLGGVDANKFAGPAEGDLLLIGADVGGENSVELFTESDDSFAGGDVEESDQPRLSPTATAHEQ